MRIEPLAEPFEPRVGDVLISMMPDGISPIALYRTFAKNLTMTEAMLRWGGYELSRHLSVDLRIREIVIDRTCARCRCEYEWGVHVAYFAERAELTGAQLRSLTAGSDLDDCWTDPREAAVIRLVDSLHDSSAVSEDLGVRLTQLFSEAQILDLLMLTGCYHAISFAARGTGVPLEPWAPRFHDFSETIAGAVAHHDLSAGDVEHHPGDPR